MSNNDYLTKLNKGDLIKVTLDKNNYEVMFIRLSYVLLKNVRKQKYILINTEARVLYFNDPQFKELYDEIDFMTFINYLHEGRIQLDESKSYNVDRVLEKR